MKQHLNIQKFWGETENTVSKSTFGAFRLSYPSSIIAALEKIVVKSVRMGTVKAGFVKSPLCTRTESMSTWLLNTYCLLNESFSNLYILS